MTPTPYEPIFLLGTTRSGSTLLSLMLGQHSQVASAGEFQWVFEYSGVEQPADMNDYFVYLEKDRFFQVHRPHLDSSLTFPELAQSILHQMKSSVDSTKPYVTVSMHTHYEAVHRIWPNAKFIHLVRDGRDVASSWMKFGWHGNTWSCAQEWATRLEDWTQLRSRLPQQQWFSVRFEDLVDDPPRQLGALCRHFGLKYQPEMLEYHRHSTYAPITKSRIRQWPRKLSRRDIQIFETIAGNHLQENDYNLSGQPPVNLSIGSVVRLRADDKIRRIQARIRDFGLWLWAAELVTRRARFSRLHNIFLHRMHRITNSKTE